MYDSAIAVERVMSDPPIDYEPIHFADLTPGEKEILRVVTVEGGYATCDRSAAFDRFVDRVSDHFEDRNADDMRLYLERDGTNYRLFVEVLDQVYAS